MSILTGSADFRICPLRATAASRATGIVANAKATSFTDSDGKIVRQNAVSEKTGKAPLISIPLTLDGLRGVNLAARTVTIEGGTRGAKVKSMSQAELDAMLAPAAPTPVQDAPQGESPAQGEAQGESPATDAPTDAPTATDAPMGKADKAQ